MGRAQAVAARDKRYQGGGKFQAALQLGTCHSLAMFAMQA